MNLRFSKLILNGFLKTIRVMPIAACRACSLAIARRQKIRFLAESISGAMLNEFKRKDWLEEKNWRGGGGGGEEKDLVFNYRL